MRKVTGIRRRRSPPPEAVARARAVHADFCLACCGLCDVAESKQVHVSMDKQMLDCSEAPGVWVVVRRVLCRRCWSVLCARLFVQVPMFGRTLQLTLVVEGGRHKVRGDKVAAVEGIWM
jgi:hypothetical protein